MASKQSQLAFKSAVSAAATRYAISQAEFLVSRSRPVADERMVIARRLHRKHKVTVEELCELFGKTPIIIRGYLDPNYLAKRRAQSLAAVHKIREAEKKAKRKAARAEAPAKKKPAAKKPAKAEAPVKKPAAKKTPARAAVEKHVAEKKAARKAAKTEKPAVKLTKALRAAADLPKPKKEKPAPAKPERTPKKPTKAKPSKPKKTEPTVDPLAIDDPLA